MSRERRERSSTTAARLAARSNEPSSYRFAPVAQHTSASTVTRSFESLIVNARDLGGDSLAHPDEFYEP